MRSQGIPYRLSGGTSWFARSEIKDMLAYLRLLSNEQDDAAFLRVVNTPKRGIGEATLHVLGQYAKEREQGLFQVCDHVALMGHLEEKTRHSLMQFKKWLLTIKEKSQGDQMINGLRDMVRESGYEEYLYDQCTNPVKAQKKMEQIEELLQWMGKLLEKNPASDLSQIVNKMMLIDLLQQNEHENTEELQLMTLHASKGLEFPFVYLVGMEEELLPHRNSIEAGDIEEERRLAYVGITRAQKALVLTLAHKRRKEGQIQTSTPSRFLAELPENYLEWTGLKNDPVKSQALAKSHLHS